MFSKSAADDFSLVSKAGDFAMEAVAPVIESFESERKVPLALLRAAAGKFAGILAPRAFGGHEASVRTTASVMAALARADLAFAFSLVVHINLTNAMARRGGDAQRHKYLDAMLDGRVIGAFCLTEPDVGTDAAAIATMARGGADGTWTLDGEKAWITNGAVADLFCVYSRTDKGEAEGVDSIAAFLVDRGEAGLSVRPPPALMGGNVMGATEIELAGCRLGAEQLFVAPGEGFKAAMQGIDLARILLSAMCCAILADGLAIATKYAAGRKAFGQSTIHFQGLQFQLAEVASALRAARLLTDDAITLIDAGGDARMAAAHAKKVSTRAAFDGLAICMQAMGANGFRRDHALPRHLANAKMAQYLDGTTEVQNLIIGRDLIRQASE